MKRLGFLLLITLVINANAGTALALPAARNVYSQDAQGSNSQGIDLKIWAGYGLTINFIPTGETIKQVWLGDPSRFALTSNGNLCQRGASDENCGSGGATILFLRQIKPISFPVLTSSQDGSTVITVITASSDGQKQYQFKLIPARGKPQYTSLIIKPDSEKPQPLLIAEKPSLNRNNLNNLNNITNNTPPQNLDKKTRLTVNTSSQASTISQRNDANAVAYGLAVAVGNGAIKPKSRVWRQTQDTIRLLRRGKSRNEAIKLSGIPQEMFNKLMQWGQTQ
ncbi:hypothetical protein [Nostoc sp. TCL26-01]|uniref:hypothetical protein n=1 Tax=Nostoc sp. TCL26-01 TaxID=2576904 RepID=UPI0015B9E9C9|nr:hypothetical protein [Nostoc sp. TCL26-01]QLE59860.1 hypothetical protein FD725_30955 [Nostoc sp. TCL26-01]